MCDHAIVVRADNERLRCGNQGELAVALAISLEDLPVDERYPLSARQTDDCLCPIDLLGLGGRRMPAGDWELRGP